MVSSYIKPHERQGARRLLHDPRPDDILGGDHGKRAGLPEQVSEHLGRDVRLSQGESDSRIRKPVAKKKIKMLTEQVFNWSDGEDETIYDHWMNGAERNGYKRETAQRIWDDVLEFASYAFNKSHSAGYAIPRPAQTGSVAEGALPASSIRRPCSPHTPARPRRSCTMSPRAGTTASLSCRPMNESGREFTATAEGVRFGLAGIRGVGEGVADAIIERQ